MGLDIYFFKFSKSVVKDCKSPMEIYDKMERGLFDCLSVSVIELRECKENGCVGYEELSRSIIGELTVYGYNGDDLLALSGTIDSLLSHLEYLLDWYCLKESMYFRKVNFLYKYFADRVDDDGYCFVTVDDVNDIISRCSDVLKSHTEGNDGCCGELLPIDSVSYDDLYFENVSLVLKRFSEFAETFDGENEICFVYFSK